MYGTAWPNCPNRKAWTVTLLFANFFLRAAMVRHEALLGRPGAAGSLNRAAVSLLRRIVFSRPATGLGPVSRATPVHTAMRNCTRDEGRSFEVGNQVLISSHRKLLSSKATVVNVAEKSEQDSDRQG